ncbi:MAG: L-fucose:H+ symporter permease [Flavobacteriaceae bacterium]|jgi:MFS transporter, FHS family, L-fucose permease|nr:L-fucose:H+ symporter permease [Flavobacteriaceae bacterium]
MTEKKSTHNPPTLEKKMILPFLIVSSLFALWGFANAVTDPMVQAFKKVLELSNAQAAWVQMAFYGGYFCMALPAAYFVRKYNYKIGIIIGLSLYAGGALLFYPAAITEQFWFFCLGLYILTFGLAFLETTANPYIISMGSPATGTRRLNLAQAFNPLGLLMGLLVAQQFVLKRLQSDDIESFAALDEAKKILIRTSDLMVIRDPYVILGLFVLGFLVLISLVKMPLAKEEGAVPPLGKTLLALFEKKMYRMGVFAQAFYVGAQIMCWTYIYQYAEARGISNTDAATYQFGAFVLFLLGRMIGTYLLQYINAAQLLRGFAVLAGVCTLLTIGSTGTFGMFALVCISFFMSIMFPTIYGETLSGLNVSDTKIGAAALVMAIVGGALMPKFQGNIIDLGGDGVADLQWMGISEINLSFALPLLSFIYIFYYSSLLVANAKK